MAQLVSLRGFSIRVIFSLGRKVTGHEGIILDFLLQIA